MVSTVYLSGAEWFKPVAIAGGVALLVLLIGYWRARADRAVKLKCLGLKILGFSLLALCLLNPVKSTEVAKAGTNYLALLVDNSESMRIQDPGKIKSRGEEVQGLLGADESNWQQALKRTYKVRSYQFDSRLKPRKEGELADWSGRNSSLGNGLSSLKNRFEGRPLAGVMVFTDGNATDMAEGIPNWEGGPPVYVVVVGSDEPSQDVRINRISVSETVFEDAPVTIQAGVSAYGFEGEKLQARMVDLEGNVIEEQIEDIRDSDWRSTFRFEFKPDEPGLSFYRFTVGLLDQRDALESAEEGSGMAVQKKEATLENNSRMIAINRDQQVARVLYVGGRPHWEFKFLNRALQGDDQLDLVGLIRVALGESKFKIKGRFGEETNPLFKGFDRTTDTTERYDQPVMIRLNTRDEAELRNGFPLEAEELFEYDAVIVDRLEAAFFRQDQLTLLQRFVSERGGGFMMLGGQESFHRGDYYRTPIAEMLPVYLDRVAEVARAASFKMKLTRDGLVEPWTRLRRTEDLENERLDEMIPRKVLNPVRGVKPGASVVYAVDDAEGKELPGVVVQPFGRGRTAAVLVGDMWLGRLRSDEHREDANKSWRQSVRWLTANALKIIDVEAKPKAGDPHGAMSIVTKVRDKEFRPMDNAVVTATVSRVGSVLENQNGSVRLPADPVLNEAGAYEALYVPKDSGAYRVDIEVVDRNGILVGRRQVGWTSEPSANEYQSLTPNRELMMALAESTGGAVIEASELDDFASTLPEQASVVTEARVIPLWHNGWMLFAALGCLVAEWGLRRRRGLV